MRKVKKVSVWLFALFAVLIVLVGAAFYIASNLVQKDSAREKIHNIISNKIGGDVHYDSMNLYFFPRPHAVVGNGEFSVPDKIKGEFQSLVVYPKLLPLFYGDVELSSLEFNSPDIKIYLSDQEKQKEPLSIEELKHKFITAMNHLNSHKKGADARVYNASVHLIKLDEEFLGFNNLNAFVSFPNNTLSYSFKGNSNITQNILVNGTINTKTYEATGDINLQGFKPHLLKEYIYILDLNPESKFRYLSIPVNNISLESNINLNLKFSSQSLEVFKGNLLLADSKIKLKKGDEVFNINAKKIDTDIYIDQNKSVFTINNAELLHPDVTVNGEHHIDKANDKVNLNLRGTDINVESSREAVLFVAGGHRIVDLIFDIVRGGTVPDITLEAGADSFKNLFKKNNYQINGSMVNGNIFIPYGDFNLTGVSGNAVIGGGKLKGTNLKAKSGNSTGDDGTFIIGLEGPVGPLHLDIKVNSDASEIPDVIKKFVDDEVFTYELSLMENIQGTASGVLKIGEEKKSPKVGIYVSDLDITGDYKRVPEPVNIKGSDFKLVDKSLDFDGLNVTIGKLVAPQTTGYYHWKEDKRLKIGTKEANIDLSIIFPWLNSFEIIKPHLKYIESIVGAAFFKSVDFEGPLSNSDEWKINAEGNVESADVSIEGFGSPMTVTDAEIESSSQDLTLSNANVKIKESIVSAGAKLNDFFRDNLKFTLDFYGDMLADEAKLFSDYFSVPEELNFKSPISLDDSSVVVQKIPDAKSSVPAVSLAPAPKKANKEIDLNINVKAESLEWADSEAEVEQAANSPQAINEAPDSEHSTTSLKGKVVVKSDNFKFKGFNWDTVDAEVALLGNRIDVNVNEASLCGIETPGVLEVTSPTLKLEFETFSEDEEFANAIKCLFDKAGIITGDFNLGGTVNSEGEIVNVLKSLEGELELTSNGGRVSKYGGLARFFSALNFGEIFRGNTIDYEDEGFPYDFIMANADIKDGKLIIKEAAMDGPSLKVVCEGSIDLVDDQLDLKVLVIPVMAVDSVIEKIPLISAVLGKDVVSIPIKVTGDISDPKISQLSPQTIGAGLLGIIKQTLNIPVTLVKPLNSGKKKEKAEKSEPENNSANTDNPFLQAGPDAVLDSKQ